MHMMMRRPIRFHSRTSYSNATPSGSFSFNHASAASLAREDFKVVDVADFLAGIDVNPDAHWSLLKLASGPVLNQIAHQPISLD
jgi:hypothetical protein